MSGDTELFQSVLDMAEAAKRQDISRWMAAKCGPRRPEDVAFLSSMMLGVLIENDAIRRGVHPADVWRQLRAQGLENFG